MARGGRRWSCALITLALGLARAQPLAKMFAKGKGGFGAGKLGGFGAGKLGGFDPSKLAGLNAEQLAGKALLQLEEHLAGGGAKPAAPVKPANSFIRPADTNAGASGGYPWTRGFRGINASQVAAVMCLGDSWQTGLNVGVGDGHYARVMQDYRGGSWGCGDGVLTGGAKVETLGTILHRFNPKLAGLSSGTYMSFELNPCKVHRQNCGLNAATDGASLLSNTNAHKAAGTHERNTTLMDEAMDLRRWIAHEHPELRTQWKVLTLMVSWGDMWWSERNTTLIRHKVRGLFNFMSVSLPYTYVNLVGVSERVSSLDDVQQLHAWCRMGIQVWKAQAFKREGTVFNSGEGADEYAAQINDILRETARDYDNGRNFIVRFRPFMMTFAFQSRLCDPITCFHPNQKLVQNMAHGLVQNMVSRSPERQTKFLPIFAEDTPSWQVEEFETFKNQTRAAPSLLFL